MELSAFICARHCYAPFGDGLLVHRLDFSPVEVSGPLFTQAQVPLPAAVAGAVPKRQAEYLAGRLAARDALALWGCQLPVGMGGAREPLWPQGFVGSISHQGTSAVAAASPTSHCSGIGIDLEGWLEPDIADQIWPGILSGQERQRLVSAPLTWSELVTLIFSAKESLFKALYPSVGRYFDFLDVALLELDLRHQRFLVQLQVALSPDLPAGMVFEGRWHGESAQVLTGIIRNIEYKLQ